ncbi:EVE domain-containing protein [Planococcus maritimus]|uniref:EVE domain-containing protein n=1 Tax=Planococcus maritimus TaxID=192421 RepID=A0A7D7REU5_PLAMR|nr:EVE domain-containing protein [Planococcus maritimus]QMT16241.1 EVE domain-containing protein [Planococcus maritimus]
MNTWIFQGNPKRFNVDDYLLENERVWWSIRQEHLAKYIELNDEVFIWRSDGFTKGSGGVVARAQIISLPQKYTNDEDSLEYWYEDVSGNEYLAVELKVLEEDVAEGIRRTELIENEELSNMMILRQKQNTNYLLSENHAEELRELWCHQILSKSKGKEKRFKLNENLKKEYQLYILPKLKPCDRAREYNFYSDELKAKVIFEHLINGKMHRWMDMNILGIPAEKNKGFDSANILYYLGMKANYRGLFQGKEMNDLITILSSKGLEYVEVVRLLEILNDRELEGNIDLDIEAELLEEGRGIEGDVKYYYGKRYERSAKNRKLAIKKHGLDCIVCGFNFEEVYGERGKDFIEVHHINPLSTLEEAIKVNPETDLVPLCANCHRIVHRRKDNILSVQVLSEIFNEKK